MEIIPVRENVFLHRSVGSALGQLFSANGLVVVTGKGILIIDTPWTEEQTSFLIRETYKRFQKKISFVIATHGHGDRIAGIRIFKENNIPVLSTSLTAAEAVKNGFMRPDPKLDLDPRLSLGKVGIEVYYPGHGHTKDNIIVWLPHIQLLYGGCFVKSLESSHLGYIGEADLTKWNISLKSVKQRYPDAKIVIPGHGEPGGANLIDHSLFLLEKGAGL
ncbi:subclass B1 metallo-beta-lactamase [Leptospira idonii]|uniref:subclass B1 metallo-beta-lactamase n=1 Tax=Leptospira idonii TaxID=1193500 RepID=UPI0014382664|nr:subclass B1 metallo-beta-lactamase [Leptospira idonii]